MINNKIVFSVTVLVFLLEPSSSTNNSLSPDSVRLYHDIVSGHGLYNGFTKLTELGGSNFKSVVFGNETNKLWLVEFYNSWCGHCHRFAPTWKALSSNIHDWRGAIGIGAVDCASDTNNQLCRDLEVMYYPMIKLFPPHSDEKFLGESFEKGTVEQMRANIITKLHLYQNSHDQIEGPVNLIPLTYSNVDTFLWNDLPSHVLYLILVFEPEDSKTGPEVMLDLSLTKEVRMRVVSSSNEQLSKAVGIEQGSNGAVVIDRELQITNLNVKNVTRISLNKAAREFLVAQGISIPLELPPAEVVVAPEVNIGDVMAIMQMEEEIKKKLQTKALSSVAFQVDLEGAIRYSLKNEVPLHRNITGAHLTALKNYMTVLIKYFPFGRPGIDFLVKLKHTAIGDREGISGKDFRQAYLRLEREYKPFLPEQGWIGCRGSKPEFRGYPCSLWTMFHTLTVHEEMKDRLQVDDGPEVLNAMAGYIKNFFTCSDCAAHFTEMAKTIAGNVTNQNDSIIWLWAAHNKVNNRLAGDATEDPEHRKIQFPTSDACPKCRTSDDSWNKTEVMTFLKHMYTNIVYLQLDDLSTTTSTTTTSTTSIPHVQPKYDRSLRHEIYGEDKGYQDKQVSGITRKSIWGFNIFDISICVILYICSVTIIILVCIKFVFKKSYRKKPYIHDLLSKV